MSKNAQCESKLQELKERSDSLRKTIATVPTNASIEFGVAHLETALSWLEKGIRVAISGEKDTVTDLAVKTVPAAPPAKVRKSKKEGGDAGTRTVV